MRTQTLRVQVFDTNQRPLGPMEVAVQFDAIGPCVVQHRGRSYCFSGKSGTHRSSGVATREMASTDDHRLRITLGGIVIWED
jgi:hypothetical protein